MTTQHARATEIHELRKQLLEVLDLHLTDIEARDPQLKLQELEYKLKRLNEAQQLDFELNGNDFSKAVMEENRKRNAEIYARRSNP